MIKTKILKKSNNPTDKALANTSYLDKGLAGDKKHYLKDTDYTVLKIGEETARLVEAICEELQIDHSTLSALLTKYQATLEKRQESREEL